MRRYLTAPHGNCSYYLDTDNGNPFDAISHMNCMRRCRRLWGGPKEKCSIYFMDRYLDELDFEANFTHNDCYNKPIDRLEDRTPFRLLNSDTIIGTEFWHNLDTDHWFAEKSLVWDSTQPMYVYREEPVMSLIDYMVFMGGLFGLWFGTNGKDFVIWIIESRFWLKLPVLQLIPYHLTLI
ncbi:unnamed protein product [Oppiella nova]|uniref:Uncharacterized protein n=1 Tax=Oppiella nova TaxID=334625 RepID=A0A7R9M9R8_9ACAR|nr:unnamed protein product [Oppiella nova]CAG2173389.1 unnamed protein product [Oppiella nova]